MGIEIERKFLVAGDDWRAVAGDGVPYRQGYLATEPERNVRVRLEGERAKLNLKSKAKGLSRAEFEYEIPRDEAEQILDGLCLRPLIEKTRYKVHRGGLVWEIDEFFGDNAGLVVAEVELESEDQEVDLPPWVGEEVSHDHRYKNANLVSRPFSTW
ncbi:MAG: CYTH domain-containing protein [Acidobacteriota bacterium]